MVAQVPTTIRTKALVSLFTQLERIEKRLTRNTIKDDIALTPFSPLRLRYRAIWHGSTLHAEVDRIRSIHTGRQPACQKSNELEVSQTPKTFLQRRKKQRELVAPC